MLVARWRGVDIRRSGSGNIGATNVSARSARFAALVVVLVDPLKGVIAVGLPMLLGLDPWIVSATAIATVLGNTFNVFLGFRGGKGIATSLGVFLIIDPLVTVLAVVLFALTLWLTRFVSLGVAAGRHRRPADAAGAPRRRPQRRGAAPKLTTALVLAAGLRRHRENIARLRGGSERRFGEPREAATATTVASTAAPAASAAALRGRRRRAGRRQRGATAGVIGRAARHGASTAGPAPRRPRPPRPRRASTRSAPRPTTTTRTAARTPGSGRARP
jgi:acyl phosphate:glycerol-3-phosphate acyltransferase